MSKKLIKKERKVKKAQVGAILNTYLGDMRNITDFNNLAISNSANSSWMTSLLYNQVPGLATPEQLKDKYKNAFPSNSSVNISDNPNISSLTKSIASKNAGLTGDKGRISTNNFSSFLSKDIGNSGISVGGGINSALEIADQFIPQAEDTGSKIASGVFDAASKVSNFIPGVGPIASVALKGLGTLFGAGVKNVKGNAKMDTVDSSASYTGADALDSKRFGILGLGKAKKYQRRVDQRQRERETAAGILNKGKDDLLASSNVQQMAVADNLNKNASDWMYRLRAGKQGMKIEEGRRLARLYNSKARPGLAGIQLKTGTDSVNAYEKGGKSKIRSPRELAIYAIQMKPDFIKRLFETPVGIDFIDDEGQPARGSHYLESAGEYVIPRIQRTKDGLKFFNHQEAVNRALKTGDYLKMSPDEAIWFAEHYKELFPNFFNNFTNQENTQKFQNGGAVNIIPAGELHARKHNLVEKNPDLEGITKKGIPVIAIDGGELNQSAEIERNEIIFSLETTKKLEELRKKYKSAESQSEKDEIAIAAGILLESEIIENTIDNTGLLKEVK